ncbi:hypothetical protein BAUCODRAFT_318152 [Baudoinia panamericana UAMH 10762]|uniref:Uncharacterized protein n=1 Tax=Baudoinia panamericana (strain UAMH 10762) TaxID=717646 RepID=M2MIV5_BAUPA|nr:uncharacterized protein BAUCODRAFT_318152 [Baudoinia panamericana UAMH 10762]EMC91203.1 hypothetical protein BAUCODRAFT_318152 [Baudoinia panamericana UAMH 10762]
MMYQGFRSCHTLLYGHGREPCILHDYLSDGMCETRPSTTLPLPSQPKCLFLLRRLRYLSPYSALLASTTSIMLPD